MRRPAASTVAHGHRFPVSPQPAYVRGVPELHAQVQTFRDLTYRHLGGQLAPVLNTLRALKTFGVWTEVTTLVVPGQNDTDGELGDMARFIATELGPETPWHLLRFFPHYQMLDTSPTPMHTLERAMEIGKTAGLNYMYLSNLLVSGMQDTYCPNCGNVVISRTGTRSSTNRMRNGHCGQCHREIPGIWSAE